MLDVDVDVLDGDVNVEVDVDCVCVCDSVPLILDVLREEDVVGDDVDEADVLLVPVSLVLDSEAEEADGEVDPAVVVDDNNVPLVVVKVREVVEDKFVCVEVDEKDVDRLLSEVIVVVVNDDDDAGPDPDVELVRVVNVSVPELDCEIVGVDDVLVVNDDVTDSDPDVDADGVVVVGTPELVFDPPPDEVPVIDDAMLVVVVFPGALDVEPELAVVLVELNVNVPVSVLATIVKLPVREESVGAMVGVNTG